MAFRTPNFNLSVNIWRGTLNPIINPPTLTVMGNLSRGNRVTAAGQSGGLDDLEFTMMLLLPALTDIQDRANGGDADVVECPAGTGRYYIVMQVDDAGKGFPNEYRWATMLKVEVVPGVFWPTPFP
jgi:hypothetical protein